MPEESFRAIMRAAAQILIAPVAREERVGKARALPRFSDALHREVRDNDVGPRGTSRLGCPGQRDGSALSGFALLHAPEPRCLGNSEEGNRGEHGDDEAENVEFPDVPRPEEARHDTPNEGTENSE